MARKEDDSVEEIEAVEEEEVVEEIVEEAADEEEVEEVAEAGDAEPPEEEEPEEEPGPQPRTPALVLVLAFLNILAAAGFVFLLLMTYSKRGEWSYAVFRHDLDLLGLPLESESDGISGSREGRSKITLMPDQLKQPFSRRGGSASEPFQHVDEVLGGPILPDHLTEATLQEVFQGLGTPVKTLEEEIRRLKAELPAAIEQAAKAFAATAKGEADKRKKIEDLLLPLTVSGPGMEAVVKPYKDPKKDEQTVIPQIDVIAKRIAGAPAKALDAMLIDAAHRRMLVDILAPLDIHRPAKLPPTLEAWKNQRDRMFDNAADSQIIKLDDLKNLLIRRLDLSIADVFDEGLHFGKEWTGEKRPSYERRPVIAYLLVAISHAKKPDQTYLLTKGPRERAQVIVGWYEYNRALQEYSASLTALFDRALAAIRTDRDGKEVLDASGKAVALNPGFVQKHAAEVERLKDIYAMIQNRNLRYIDLQGQLQKHADYYKARVMHEKEVRDRLAKAQAKTKVEQAELDLLKKQLDDARAKLKTASETNLRIEAEIRRHMGLQASIPEGKVP